MNWYSGLTSMIKHSLKYTCIYIYLFLNEQFHTLLLDFTSGIPLVYELTEDMKPVRHYYLADEASVKAALEKVANQGKAK